MSSRFSFGFEVEKKGFTPGLMKQVHGNTIIACDEKNCDREADGVFTEMPEREVHVFTADCLPVLFASPRRVAAIHAGWRGAKKGIVSGMLGRYLGEMPSLVVLGPCLKACCFEVKEDFIREFSAERGDLTPFLVRKGDQTFFDLVSFVLERELAGVPKERIDLQNNRCTYCSQPELPSYRRNKGTDPRIRAWIKFSTQ